LRSASTSIPGLVSTASSSAWNALQYSKKGWADFSNTATGLTYTNTTGATTLTAGYIIPQTASTTQWNKFFHASTSLPYLANTTELEPLWRAASTSVALSSSLNSYLLRSASTSIPGLISTASSSAWNALQYSKKGWADFSNTATGLTYTNTTGATSLTTGYIIPQTASTTQWNKLFHASTSLPYLANTTELEPLWRAASTSVALSSSLNSYLLRSASTSIPGLVSTASSSAWNALQYSKKGWADFSNTATGLTYTNTTGATTLTAGYIIPLSASTTQWNKLFHASTSVAYLSGATFTGSISATNLSGTNTGDNAANSTYASDYRAGNFIAGTNYLAPTGNFHGTWGGYSTTTLPGLVSSASSSAWNALQYSKKGWADFSNTATGLTYTNTTGATTLTAGYIIPQTASTTQWNKLFHASTSLLTTATELEPLWRAASTSVALSSSLNSYLLRSASTSIPGLISTASSSAWNGFYQTPSGRISLGTGLSWTGNSIGINSSYLLPLAASTTQWNKLFHASTTFALSSSLNSYLLRSASTSIPGLVATASTTQWNKLFHASTTFALSSSLNSYLLRSASTSIPGLISTASSSAWNALQYSKKGWADFTNTAAGLTYTNTTGATSLTTGYIIPQTASTTQWNKFFHASTTFALSSSLNSYLLRSASTSVPGLISTASSTQWNKLFHASTTLATTASLTTTNNYATSSDATFTVASSSLAGGWPSTGTSSARMLGIAIRNETWVSAWCYLDSGTSVLIQFGNCASAYTPSFTVTTAVSSSTFASNNVFSKDTKRCYKIGSVSGSPGRITCTIQKKIQAGY
jgi:hypothetical protein